MIDETLDEDNPFKNIDAEDIWIEDDLFDGDEKQAVKNISKEIYDISNTINDAPIGTINNN